MRLPSTSPTTGERRGTRTGSRYGLGVDADDDRRSPASRPRDDRATLPLLSETIPGFDVPRAYDVLSAITQRREHGDGRRSAGRSASRTARSGRATTCGSRCGLRSGIARSTGRPTGTRVLDLDLARAAPHRDRGRVLPPRRPARDRRRRAPFSSTPHGSPRGSRSCSATSRAGGSRPPTARLRSASTALSSSVRRSILDDAARDRLVDELTRADVTLRRGDEVVDTGVSSVVLDSPACALATSRAASTIRAGERSSPAT